MKNLRVLHLKDNCLETMPDGFPNLKYLNLAGNKLSDLSLLYTKELVALDASNNQLEALPRGLFMIKHLRRLRLNGRLQIYHVAFFYILTL